MIFEGPLQPKPFYEAMKGGKTPYTFQTTSAGSFPSLDMDPYPKTEPCKAEGRAWASPSIRLCTSMEGLNPFPPHQCSLGMNGPP